MTDLSANTVLKVKLICFTVAASSLLLLWQSMGKMLSQPFQLIFLGASLLLTGIPHGALDHLVQQEQSRRQHHHFHLLWFLGRYVAMMLGYALTWYLIPQFSLAFFLLISCWHFGETDISTLPQAPVWSVLLRLLYGIAILGWILFAHQQEVSPILMQLVNPQGLFYRLWLLMAAQSPRLIVVLGFVILSALIFNIVTGNHNRYKYWLLGQLVFILLCGYVLPLLLAFALYFAGWHSLVTLFNIKGFITHEQTTSNKPLFKLWLKAIPFSLLAISGLVLAGYLLRYYAPLFNPLPLLFVFLSLITLPHTEVMHKLNSTARN